MGSLKSISFFSLIAFAIFFSGCVQKPSSDPTDTGASNPGASEPVSISGKTKINGEGYQGALKIKISKVSLATITSPNGAIQTIVTVLGENFIAGAKVTINDMNCDAVSVGGVSSLSCTVNGEVVPESVGAAITVVVSAPEREQGVYSPPVNAPLAPVLTSVSPASGLTSGGTVITLTGENFVNGATIKVGAQNCGQVAIVSATSANCQVPASPSAQTLPVTLTNPDEQSATKQNAFAYTNPPPTVLSVSPNVGSTIGGTAITITGTGFLSSPAVLIGGSSCLSVNRLNATTITCAVPSTPSAGAVAVKVTNSDGLFSNLAGGFTYQYPAPTFSSVTPNSGLTSGGTAITIIGNYFRGVPTVLIGGNSCLNVARPDAQTITCNTPPGSLGSAAIRVTHNDDNKFVEMAAAFTYSAPSLGTWVATKTTGAPTARRWHTAVWTGQEMIIWGGYANGFQLSSGGRYNPVNDSWTPTTTTQAPATRYAHTAIWTGTGMIVWGGYGQHSGIHGSGSTYNPASNSWTALAANANMPSPRAWHSAVWTDDQMIIWGGYDWVLPALSNGASYNPLDGSWTPLNSSGAPGARYKHSAVWTGSQMIVWGGDVVGGGADNTGGVFTLSTNSWTPTNTAGAPNPRSEHSAVWVNGEMIIFGGSAGAGATSDGAIYNLAGDSWRPISTSGAPSARKAHTAVWTGSKMIVFGGVNSATYRSDGFSYDVSGNSWSPIESVNAPSARAYHTAIWTQQEMIVWGGSDDPSAVTDFNSGARFTP